MTEGSPMSPEMEQKCIDLMKLYATFEPVDPTPEQTALLYDLIDFVREQTPPALVKWAHRIHKKLAETLTPDELEDLHVRIIRTLDALWSGEEAQTLKP